MFGFAQTGTLPELDKCVLKGFRILVRNVLFFTPRRNITVDIEVISSDQIPAQSRREFNKYLENWYNESRNFEYVEPVLVPYDRFFQERTPDVKPSGATALQSSGGDFSSATREVIEKILAEKFGCRVNWDTIDSTIPLDHLGLDSFERLELATEIEGHFNVQCHVPPTTLADAMALAEGRGVMEEVVVAESPAWMLSQQSSVPALPQGAYILEAFIRQCRSTPQNVAMADDETRTFTYEDVLLRVLLVANHLGVKSTGEYLGILLPASCGASITLLASHAAGRVPVYLNWTTGTRALQSAIATCEIQTILTSRAFYDRQDFDLEIDRILFMEDILEDVSLKSRLFAKIQGSRSADRLLRTLPASAADDVAVVLFTSGSENAPKAVPLTHQNLMSNVAAVSRALDLRQSDRMMGFLPPFHSFGVLGGMLCPLLTGMRVVYHPDPTASRAIVQKISVYKTNLLISTPTFLEGILRASKGQELDSLETVITGAERAPAGLQERLNAKAPRAQIGQGYGITECSPVISINRTFSTNNVGKPLDTLSVQIVCPDTFKPVTLGESGLLLVRGPSIFNEYLRYNGPSPFYHDGVDTWYLTGDIVSLDVDGSICFTERLKRFIKSAGEMVSLPLLESVFQEVFPADETGPQIAVEGVESEGGSRIALFTKQRIDTLETLDILRRAGLRGANRIDEVRVVDEIPLLGSGKVDYRCLRNQLLSCAT